jgi:hypothetical protein
MQIISSINLFARTKLEYIAVMELDGGAVRNEPTLSEGIKHLPPADLIDPVIEEYKKGIDASLIAENLKRTPHQRAIRMGQTIDWINELRRRRQSERR